MPVGLLEFGLVPMALSGAYLLVYDAISFSNLFLPAQTSNLFGFVLLCHIFMCRRPA